MLTSTRRFAIDSYNKIDAISLEEVDRIAREPDTVVISCSSDLNLDVLKRRCWEMIGLNRVYTKKRGATPDLSDPLIVKKEATIENIVSFAERVEQLSEIACSTRRYSATAFTRNCPID